MERVVEDFILYLHETKNTSKNTEVSYERDLKKIDSVFTGAESYRFFRSDMHRPAGVLK